MKPTIKKYNHYSFPPTFGLHYNKRGMKRRVIFHANCRYDLKGIDQYDQNKLFGIGYFPSHHKESVRFGWRYNLETGKIVIASYCYVNSIRIIEDLCEVDLLKPYDFTIQRYPSGYSLSVIEGGGNESGPIVEHHVGTKHSKKWGYPLGFYFGGNCVLKKDISITMYKL